VKKKPEQEPKGPAEPEADPWTCTACAAPELERGVRVGSRTYCVTCFYEAPGATKGRFVSRVRPKT
jgi:hypothetical protein